MKKGLLLALIAMLLILSAACGKTDMPVSTDTQKEAEAPSSTESGTQTESESETETESKSESATESEAETESESESESETKVTDYTERYRPQYHFSAADSWINDPNGLVFYEGVWHMYYQSNPHTPHFGNLSWGHATSTDLVHWNEEGWVLLPDDVGMIFSGTAAVDTENRSGLFGERGEGIIVAYSTSTQKIGFAYSTDGGYTYTKFSETEPILDNDGVTEFRDPHLFWYEPGQKWILVVAGGYVRIFESTDLRSWGLSSVSDIYTECPNLFSMTVEGTDETKWVLTCAGRTYYVGEFDGYAFTPETGAISMNEGPDSYAGITFSNVPDHRTIMISWLNNWNYPEPPDGIWSGCMTLPQELTLTKRGDTYRLLFQPAEEVSLLRETVLFSAEDLSLQEGQNPFTGLKSNTFEIVMAAESDCAGFELDVCVGKNEATRLYFDFVSGNVIFSRLESQKGIPELKTFCGTVTFTPETLSSSAEIRIFVDVSNVELYIDGVCCFTARIQPLSKSLGIELHPWEDMTFRSLTVYEYTSIWSN